LHIFSFKKKNVCICNINPKREKVEATLQASSFENSEDKKILISDVYDLVSLT
jgi:hypothetical protein